MELFTRCPACATTLEVAREQPDISDGWVRCRRCSQVLDVSVDLKETETVGAQPASVVASSEFGLSAMEWPDPDFLQLGDPPAKPMATASAGIEQVKAKVQDEAVINPMPVVLAASESEPECVANRTPSFDASARAGERESSSRPKPRRRRRGWLVAWVLAILLLVVLLLYLQRDGVVERQPALRALFERLCRVTGCQV